jgi:hypothetical protein
MNRFALAAFGWLVPGGAYLLLRRYTQFAAFAVLVTAAFAGGLLFQGSSGWPQPAELAGVDGFTAFGFRAIAAAKALAGGPYLVARLFDTTTFLDGRLHEYGTALLLLSGLANLLAVSTALDLRKEAVR